MLQDLRFAARMLRRSPGFSAAAVIALAIGIGANAAVFTVIESVLLRPLDFPAPERLMLISAASRDGRGPHLRLSDREYVDFRSRDGLFESMATFSAAGFDLAGAGEPVHLDGGSVTGDFLRVLGVAPSIGRGFTPADERSRVVLLSNGLWRSRFAADPKVEGRKVMLNGIPHVVIGVMPPGFAFPDDAQLWVPLEVRVDPHMSLIRPTVGRLRPGVLRRAAEAELAAMLPPDRKAQIAPLKEFLVSNIRESLAIFAGAVAFVLLIACANVANMMLIRASSRGQEIATRAALGASRWRIARALLAESALISLIGGAVGLLLALWAVPILLSLAPQGEIPRAGEVHLDLAVVAFTFGLAVATGMLFGLAPVVHVWRGSLRENLAGTRTVTRSRTALRGVLVVSELAFALTLLAAAGLMIKSFVRIRGIDPGFRPDNVITMSVSLPEATYRTTEAIQEFHARVLDRLAALPGVTAAGAASFRPLGGYMLRGDFTAEGYAVPPDYLADKPLVTPGYFRAMGIRLLRGRDFTPHDDARAPKVAVVSRTVAREIWRGEDPIGKRISMQAHPKADDWITVIGVVEDVRQDVVTQAPGRAIYRSYTQPSPPYFIADMTYLVRTTVDPFLLAPALRQTVREVDPSQPVQALTTMQDVIASQTAGTLFQTRLLAGFSILALFLAAVGVYAVLAYSVVERTREIGIRMALGADRGEVLRTVVLRTARLSAAGIALGMAAALAGTRVLSSLLYEVRPSDPWALAGAGALLAAAALVAGWLPARRATRIDPLAALRYE